MCHFEKVHICLSICLFSLRGEKTDKKRKRDKNKDNEEEEDHMGSMNKRITLGLSSSDFGVKLNVMCLASCPKVMWHALSPQNGPTPDRHTDALDTLSPSLRWKQHSSSYCTSAAFGWSATKGWGHVTRRSRWLTAPRSGSGCANRMSAMEWKGESPQGRRSSLLYHSSTCMSVCANSLCVSRRVKTFSENVLLIIHIGVVSWVTISIHS